MRGKLLLFYILYFSCSEAAETEEPMAMPDCDSNIYCQGDLLKAVQLSNIFDSSLDFVNRKLEKLPKLVEDDFNALDPTEKDFDAELRSFVEDNFREHLPESIKGLKDWKPFLGKHIKDREYQEFYQEINQFWNKLAEATTLDAKKNPEYHSMIHLPNYYIKASENTIDLPPSWRSYLIVRGLLSNKMFQTAAGIIRNYAQLIESHDFALYSNRVYFGQRSSLPFLALMAQEYVEENPEDTDFKSQLIQSIEKDYMWWHNNRRGKVVKDGNEYFMFRYHHISTDPRPDNYKEDHKLTEKLSTEEKTQYYSTARDLDESIIKLSSRFIQSGKHADNRLNSQVSNRIPVELNCLLLKNVEIMASWHWQLRNKANYEYWNNKAKDIAKGIKEVLYDEDRGAWFDWNLSTGENDYTYYITNLMPLCTIIEDDRGKRAEKALKYMINEEIITDEFKPNYFIIPTSKVETAGAEWDYPYGSVLWNMFIIVGLRNANHGDANELSTKLGLVLIDTIYTEFDTNKRFSEHYRVSDGRKYIRKESIGAGESKKNIEVESSSIKESDKIFASTLGATIDLLKIFGRTAKPGDRTNIINGSEADSAAKKMKKT